MKILLYDHLNYFSIQRIHILHMLEKRRSAMIFHVNILSTLKNLTKDYNIETFNG